MGESQLTVTVTGADGKAIDDAQVEVEGDMAHAGMVPVNGTAGEGLDGRYQVPFRWTMGGDWVVTVKVSLPGGGSATKQFPLTVSSGK